MVDLGMHPLCESFLDESQLDEMEPFYPLHVRVCGNCFLAQIGEFVTPEQIFDDYAYFSSYSTSWLEHARRYVEMMIDRFGLDASATKVLEIASNDGYLLQYFQTRGFQVLGVEPAGNVAAVAEEKGVPTLGEFFGDQLADRLVSEGYRADLVVGNNVLAHTPELNGFVEGVRRVLAPDGVATFEFPHLLKLIAENQFDTIYHEHWSYFSLGTAKKVLEAHGLAIFDVEELTTHGGSLRVFVKHQDDRSQDVVERVDSLVQREREFGLFDLATYIGFSDKVEETKRKLLSALITAKTAGESIAIYGAAGKGNTLLNYCGIGTDFIEYACDLNTYKQGRYTPGTHIPIFSPERIRETKPDLILILPWNIKEEIMKQISYISEWGGRFLVPIPEAQIYEAPRQ